MYAIDGWLIMEWNGRQEQWKDYSITRSAESLPLHRKTKYEIKPNSHHNEIVCRCVYYSTFVESIAVVNFMMQILKKQPSSIYSKL